MLKSEEEIEKDFHQLKEVTRLKDFSKIIKVEPKNLSYILYRIPKEKLYTRFEIPKKSGDMRTIYAPHRSLKNLQIRLAKLLCSICQCKNYEKNLLPMDFQDLSR